MNVLTAKHVHVPAVLKHTDHALLECCLTTVLYLILCFHVTV